MKYILLCGAILCTASFGLVGAFIWPAHAADNGVCPSYQTIQCQPGYSLENVTIPLQFQKSGCATTTQLCKPNPAQDPDSARASRNCAINQKFNESTLRCENTSASCAPFLRFCARNERATGECACSPSLASDQGQPLCVPQPSCPDNRVVNCEATGIFSVRECPVNMPKLSNNPAPEFGGGGGDRVDPFFSPDEYEVDAFGNDRKGSFGFADASDEKSGSTTGSSESDRANREARVYGDGPDRASAARASRESDRANREARGYGDGPDRASAARASRESDRTNREARGYGDGPDRASRGNSNNSGSSRDSSSSGSSRSSSSSGSSRDSSSSGGSKSSDRSGGRW